MNIDSKMLKNYIKAKCQGCIDDGKYATDPFHKAKKLGASEALMSLIDDIKFMESQYGGGND